MFHLHANIQRANYIVPHLRETGVIARTIKEWILYNYTIFWLIDNVSTGLKITAGRSPVKMTGQLDFSSVKICF